ncbi:MAG: hypothetical protein FWE65_00635, partial [Eggerthellaceae bacterium]|nr:hypothetical protein [Eggerthellaceae bacterium]
VIPTPGGGGGTTYTYSQMIFTNVYWKVNDGTIEDPTLTLSKTVTGELGNRQLYFNFSLTVNAPSLVYNGTGTAPVYKGYVVEDVAGVVTVVTSADNGTIDGSDLPPLGGYFNFTSGVAKTINLKHGQRLVFLDNPVGSTYTVSELSPTGYEPSYIVTTDGTAAAKVDGTLSTTLTTGTNLIGEALNKTAFTNNRDTITPTGITMNELPFVGLVALALGALIAFIVVKSRKNKRYEQ